MLFVVELEKGILYVDGRPSGSITKYIDSS
jgi:hypothetical protein